MRWAPPSPQCGGRRDGVGHAAVAAADAAAEIHAARVAAPAREEVRGREHVRVVARPAQRAPRMQTHDAEIVRAASQGGRRAALQRDDGLARGHRVDGVWQCQRAPCEMQCCKRLTPAQLPPRRNAKKGVPRRRFGLLLAPCAQECLPEPPLAGLASVLQLAVIAVLLQALQDTTPATAVVERVHLPHHLQPLLVVRAKREAPVLTSPETAYLRERRTQRDF